MQRKSIDLKCLVCQRYTKRRVPGTCAHCQSTLVPTCSQRAYLDIAYDPAVYAYWVQARSSSAWHTLDAKARIAIELRYGLRENRWPIPGQEVSLLFGHSVAWYRKTEPVWRKHLERYGESNHDCNIASRPA